MLQTTNDWRIVKQTDGALLVEAFFSSACLRSSENGFRSAGKPGSRVSLQCVASCGLRDRYEISGEIAVQFL